MAEAGARIGPNAVLQLVPVLDAHLGTDRRCALLAEAGIRVLPDGTGMIDEQPVARLHQVLRARHPQRARALATRAGAATGDYILKHRIPQPAQRLLRALPAWLSARLLAKAIEKHAWTFAGSGRFRVASARPLVFEIADNPVVRGEHASGPVCDWHSAVFERLYGALVSADYACEESHCAARGDRVCRFVLIRDRR